MFAILLFTLQLPTMDDPRLATPELPTSGVTPAGQLVAELESHDGECRLRASRELFRRGRPGLAALEKAGASPLNPEDAGIHTRRLDLIYSLINGIDQPKTGERFSTRGFGLQLRKGTTKAEARALARKHGLILDGPFTPDATPQCYVTITSGMPLAEVLREVLCQEAKVRSVNLEVLPAGR